MFNPAYMFVIEENGEDGYYLVSEDKMRFGLNIVVFTLIMSALYSFMLLFIINVWDILLYIWDLLWSSLTPGNQYLELFTAFTSICSAFAVKLLMERLTEEINDELVSMQEEINNKNKRIEELELEILNKNKK